MCPQAIEERFTVQRYQGSANQATGSGQLAADQHASARFGSEGGFGDEVHRDSLFGGSMESWPQLLRAVSATSQT